MRRPQLDNDEFGLETEAGEGLLEVHSGQRALLYCDRPELTPGLFLRRGWQMD